MKIKIEADFALNERQTLRAIVDALKTKECLELLEAFPEGEHFKMDNQYGQIVITKL